MYYKVYTSNGNYTLGYLFNIENVDEVRNYLLWELNNRYNDDLVDDEKFEMLETKINAIDLSSLEALKSGETVRIDGFFERLDVTASDSKFPSSDLSVDQKDLAGSFPW